MDKLTRSGSVMLDDEKITLTGVTKVLQNNNKIIALIQGERTLTVGGEGFNVTELNLESGRLSATGNVRELKYTAAHEKQEFLKRIFK